ncbi:MAG: AIPR family protein, partial [Verrucomicrobia bacterium]|nr:AIPR family protein [Verrucomicrobiota bacterium]
CVAGRFEDNALGHRLVNRAGTRGLAVVHTPPIHSQTVAVSQLHRYGLVTTRVIVRGSDGDEAPEDDSWLQNVIRGVNTQNRVKAADFWSNEPEQFELQHRFREMNVFYEKKRGEWKEFRNEPRYRNFDTISLPDVGKILTIASDYTGEGVLLVKQGEEEVFADKHYRQLFPSRSKVARKFEKIYLGYRVCSFLEKYGYKSSDIANKQRHAFWNCLWLLYRGITSIDRFHTRASIHSIRAAFDRFDTTGRDAQRAKKTVRMLTQLAWSAWRSARKADPEKWTANNFFKSRFGNTTILRKAYPQVLSALKRLGRELLENR